MGKKGHQKFTDIWVNQTNLGKQFGLSAIAMGKKFKELSLRGEDGNPTVQALAEGYCTSTPLKDGTPFFMWNRQKIEELMQAHGFQRLDPQEVKARELADSWVQVQRSMTVSPTELLHEKREDILRAASKRGASNIRVFGSVARGEADSKSDIDLLVDLEPGRSLFDLGGLLMDLQDLLGQKVDIVTERGLRERIRERVLKEAVPL